MDFTNGKRGKQSVAQPDRHGPAPSFAAATSIGSQILLDLYDCETPRLDDQAWVERTMILAAQAAGATIVESVFHKFSPWGISGVVVIAESHLAIHVWPEKCFAAIDLFTCGATVRPEIAFGYLINAFESRHPVRRSFARGDQLAHLTLRRTATLPAGS